MSLQCLNLNNPIVKRINKRKSLDNKFIRNPQVYYLPLSEDKIITYLPYDKKAVLINKKQKNYFEHHRFFDECGDDRLLDGGLYIDLKTARKFFITPPTLKFKPKSATLMLTSRCNGNCVYCYASENAPQAPDLDYTSSNYLLKAYKIKNICFSGWGEPTLRIDIIKAIVDDFKDECKYTIVTNGFYFNKRKEITKFLVQNKFYISLSYDGPSEITNRQRPLSNRKKSNEEILATIDAFKMNDISNSNLSVYVTVTQFSVNQMSDIVQYLHSLGINQIKFEPVELTGRAKRNITKPEGTPPNLHIFADKLIESIKLGEKIGVKVSSNLFHLNDPKCAHCGVTSLVGIVLSNDLTIQACWEPTPRGSPFYIGKLIKNGDKFEIELYNKKIDALKKRHSYSLEECRFCPVKCGGGCVKQSWETYGDLKHAGESKAICDTKRDILEKYLKYKFEEQLK